MADVDITPEQIRDPAAKNNPDSKQGRDPERTPMQWDDSANAGFSSSEPWLPVAQDFATNNVAVQENDPKSHLGLAKKLLKLRNSSFALRHGDYASLSLGDGIFAYTRSYESEKILVVLNFTNNIIKMAQKVPVEKIIVSSHGSSDFTEIEVLQPNEAIVALP